ncbi:hypothetical protein [Streptomyces sioyaensis]|uniref:hypothetical protein n=1 Tax=Streptomyces sioyaensis TaxID=67364 RepID=UPI003D7313FD
MARAFEVITGEEFQRVATALREVDARLPGQLRSELRKAARPLVARAKTKVRALPTHGRSHTGLRRRVAAGVGIRVSTSRHPGVTITTKMADPSEAVIPRGMDSQRGWRHPVFGDTDNWVTQHTGGSWFRETFADGRDEVQAAVRQVLENAAQTIADAGGRM